MPELPEVETTCRGIRPHLENRIVREVRVQNPSLRWPVPEDLATKLAGMRIESVDRRGKYLLLRVADGAVMVHLGMSGSLRIVDDGAPRRTHDHVELVLEDGRLLRFNDPRRFGAWLWADDCSAHPLLRNLGPEPLSPEFDGDYLYRLSRGRRAAIKSFIMDHHVVVGVGNIYATEALFTAGIHPARAAGRVGAARYRKLAMTIKSVLEQAIEQGGTTLRDFINSNGQPGYFRQSLAVYGRAGEPCRLCGRPLRERQIGQRSSVYCTHCQR